MNPNQAIPKISFLRLPIPKSHYRFNFYILLLLLLSRPASAGDVLQYAAQMGRLDFISGILASLTIVIAFGGIFAFLNIKKSSKDTAKEIAREIAKQEAERAANNYLQEKLPEIIASYDDLIKNKVDASVADQIADAQEKQKNEYN